MLWHAHPSDADLDRVTGLPQVAHASSARKRRNQKRKTTKSTIACSLAIVTPAISWSASGAQPPDARSARARSRRRPASAAARAGARAARRGRTPRTRRRRAHRTASRRGTFWTSGHHISEAGREVARVLDVDQPRLMLERGVVDRRHVPREVVREPHRQRDRGVDERRARRAGARARAPSRVETPSTAKSGAHSARITFCSRCARQQVVQAEVVQRRPERDGQQHHRSRRSRRSVAREAPNRPTANR